MFASRQLPVHDVAGVGSAAPNYGAIAAVGGPTQTRVRRRGALIQGPSDCRAGLEVDCADGAAPFLTPQRRRTPTSPLEDGDRHPHGPASALRRCGAKPARPESKEKLETLRSDQQTFNATAMQG